MEDQTKILEAAKAQIESAMNNAFQSVAGGEDKDGDTTDDKKIDTEGYVEPIQDPYGKAIKYLEKHNIMQLFQALTASIVYTKPEDPLQSMMKEIEIMKKQSS